MVRYLSGAHLDRNMEGGVGVWVPGGKKYEDAISPFVTASKLGSEHGVTQALWQVPFSTRYFHVLLRKSWCHSSLLSTTANAGDLLA